MGEVVPFKSKEPEFVIDIDVLQESECDDYSKEITKTILLELFGEGFEVTNDDPIAYDLLFVKESVKSLLMRLNEMDYPLQLFAENLYNDATPEEILVEFDFQ